MAILQPVDDLPEVGLEVGVVGGQHFLIHADHILLGTDLPLLLGPLSLGEQPALWRLLFEQLLLVAYFRVEAFEADVLLPAAAVFEVLPE